MGDTGTHLSWGRQVEFESISSLKSNVVKKPIDEPGSQTTWLSGPTLSLTNCITLNKLLDLSCASVCSPVYGDNNNVYLIRLL